jgi:hypothetical protein
MKSTPRCDICNGKFGLIRHRFAQKQFCSKRCLNQYLVKRKQQPSSVTQWKALAGLKAFRWLRDKSGSRLNGLRSKGMLFDPGKRPGIALPVMESSLRLARQRGETTNKVERVSLE